MGEKWKLTDFGFSEFKITVDDDCSHEIKRCLILGRKAMTNLDSTLNKAEASLCNKILYSQSYGPALTFIHDYWKNHMFD